MRDAIAAGVKHPAGVHRHHGVKVNCGRCLSYIDAEIQGACAAVPAK